MNLCEFEDSLVDKASSRTARATQKKLVSKNKKQKECKLTPSNLRFLLQAGNPPSLISHFHKDWGKGVGIFISQNLQKPFLSKASLGPVAIAQW